MSHAKLLEQCPRLNSLAAKSADPLQPARRGAYILDCVLVEPDQWWIGYHRADQIATRWPGGMLALDLPTGAVSRAWLKMEEAMRWSHLPMPVGTQIAEIGSAPGGASQALLARGMIVTGIDPAEMAPEVLKHAHVHPYSPPKHTGSQTRVSKNSMADSGYERGTIIYAGCGGSHCHAHPSECQGD